MKRKLTFLSDGGHGWLSVTLKDVAALGVAADISTYSHMNERRAFLEEDCDAGIFMDAAKAAGWDITIKESDTSMSGPHWVRNLASFMPYFCENPFGEDSAFSYRGVNGVRSGRWLRLLDGSRYTFRKTNPLLALNPPLDMGAT